MGKIAEQIRFSNQPFFEEATQDWTDNLAEICGLSTVVRGVAFDWQRELAEPARLEIGATCLAARFFTLSLRKSGLLLEAFGFVWEVLCNDRAMNSFPPIRGFE